MNNAQLVPVFTGELQGEQRQLCDARVLHTFIESKREFATWIKSRIGDYGFVEGDDYLTILSNRSDGRGGKRRIDYQISLDMAKELAMVENNDKGRVVRRYFIAVEKRANETYMRGMPSIGQQLAAHGIRLRLLDKIEIERHPEKRRAIHEQLDHASRLLGVSTPAIDAIGYSVAPTAVPAVVEAFWEAVELIGIEKLNHSRSTGFLAINLLHFHKLADEAKIKAPPLDLLRRALRLSESPRFFEIKTTNSTLLDRSVKCWVFEAEAAVGLHVP